MATMSCHAYRSSRSLQPLHVWRARCRRRSLQRRTTRPAPVKVIVPFSPGGAVDGPMRVIAQELVEAPRASRWSSRTSPAPARRSAARSSRAPRPTATRCCSPRRPTRSARRSTRSSPTIRSRTSRRSRSSAREPGVLVVNPALPVKTFQEFIAYVKERPGQVDYASSGNGSGQHLFAALLASSTGLKMNHIPYKGSGQATTDLLGGQVMVSIPGTAGHGRPHQGRQAARARGDGREALAAAARRADGDGIRRPGLRGVRVDGIARAEGHAAGDHRSAPSRADRRCWRRPRSGRTWRRPASRSSARRRPSSDSSSAPRRTSGRRSSARRARRSTESRVRRRRHDAKPKSAPTLRSRASRTGPPRQRPTATCASSCGRSIAGTPEGKPAVLFVHGSSMASQPTFDLDGSRPARLVGDGLVRAARLRLLVRRHGRLRALRQDARHLLRHRQRRRRSRRGDRLHRCARAASARS